MGTDPLCHAAPPRLGTQSKGLPGPIGTLPCLQGVPACFATLLCAPCLESLARGLFGWRRGCGYWQRGEGGTEAKGVESYLSWTLNSNLNFLGCKGHSVPDGGHSLGEGSAVGGSTVCGCFYDGLD